MPAYYLRKPFSLLKDIFGQPRPRIGTMDYADYWQTRGDSSWTTRYDIFAGFIETGSSVLDLGCGDGYALDYLREKKGIRGSGMDISGPAVEKAREHGVEAELADITAPGFELSGTYDYILISEVIKHIARPEDLLRKTRGHFTKGLIISIPNSGHYIHRLRLLAGRFPVQWMLHPGEHLRFWTLRDFRNWAAWLGFEVVAVKSNTGVLFLHRVCPSLFADNLVFLIKKTGGTDTGLSK